MTVWAGIRQCSCAGVSKRLKEAVCKTVTRCGEHQEWIPGTGYTGRDATVKVSYVLAPTPDGPELGLDPDFVAISITLIETNL